MLLRIAAATAAQHPRSSQSSEVVLICGSVFIMAEARAAIGIVEPCDSPPVREVHGAHFKADHTPQQRQEGQGEQPPCTRLQGRLGAGSWERGCGAIYRQLHAGRMAVIDHRH